MTIVTNVGDFFKVLGPTLKLNWVGGNQALEEIPLSSNVTSYGTYVSFLNTQHPCDVQIIGSHQAKFISLLDDNQSAEFLANILDTVSSCLIVGSECAVPSLLLQQNCLAIFKSDYISDELIDILWAHLPSVVGKREICHGVFMSVFGLGVLIIGQSGAGKSQLALDLLHKKHFFVADDIVYFIKTPFDRVVGYVPAQTFGFLAVHQLGILSIPDQFGEHVVLMQHRLDAVVELTANAPPKDDETTLLQGNNASFVIHNTVFPRWIIQVNASHSLSTMVETRVKQLLLSRQGIHAWQDLQVQTMRFAQELV